MTFPLFFIILAISFIAFIIIQKLSKNKRPVKRAFLSLLSGGLTLILVDALSVFTGVYIPISLLSITVSLVGGIPGVTTLLALNLIL
ncbi:MAG: pro-sigmaK processing inhibitor BofA family protein [Ruminococcus sp.]|nr:pro-sigmaK processing inhibitor BofA family protein [Ruminococcus sp.]